MLKIYSDILAVTSALVPTIERIEKRDADLGRQMRRAIQSVGLNTAEGMWSAGGNKRLRYRTAAGSMRETLACVEVGHALGYVDAIEASILDRIGKILGTLANLTR